DSAGEHAEPYASTCNVGGAAKGSATVESTRASRPRRRIPGRWICGTSSMPPVARNRRPIVLYDVRDECSEAGAVKHLGETAGDRSVERLLHQPRDPGAAPARGSCLDVETL